MKEKDNTLFIGFPLSEDYQFELDQVPSAVKGIFISDHPSDYLQKVTREGIVYLGKKVESPFDLMQSDSTKANIFSLLNKLVPDYPYDEQSLYLMAL